MFQANVDYSIHTEYQAQDESEEEKNEGLEEAASSVMSDFNQAIETLNENFDMPSKPKDSDATSSIESEIIEYDYQPPECEYNIVPLGDQSEISVS